MGGGIGLPFCWVVLETAQLGAGDEWCASGVTPVGWEGVTVKYPVGVVIQGIGPLDGRARSYAASHSLDGRGSQWWSRALGIVPTG